MTRRDLRRGFAKSDGTVKKLRACMGLALFWFYCKAKGLYYIVTGYSTKIFRGYVCLLLVVIEGEGYRKEYVCTYTLVFADVTFGLVDSTVSYTRSGSETARDCNWCEPLYFLLAFGASFHELWEGLQKNFKGRMVFH